MLVLAGAERLDKELMIGQMQGKFQLEVLTGVGHMIHEVRDSCVPQSHPLTLVQTGRSHTFSGAPGRILEAE